MSDLLTTSKRFLEWAQSLPDVVIPAGLESDIKEAIAEDYSARNLSIIVEAMQELRVSDCADWRVRRGLKAKFRNPPTANANR